MENPILKEVVSPENDLKNMLIEYVGERLLPQDKGVTVEMIIEVMAAEFPEFLLVLAEENWIRGYQQAMDDVGTGESLYKQENEKKKNCKLCEE